MPLGAFPAGSTGIHHIAYPCGPDNSNMVKQAAFSLATSGDGATVDGHIWFVSTTDAGPGGKPIFISEEDFTLDVHVRRTWKCPANTDQIIVDIRTTHDRDVAWCLELTPR